MSYDIHVIAINQKEPIKVNFNSKIIVQNEIDDYMVGRYAEIWPFFSNTSGILYSLVVEMNEDYYWSFPICDSDFETEVEEYYLPKCLLEDNKEDLTPFLVREPYVQDFEKIIQYCWKIHHKKEFYFKQDIREKIRKL